MSRHHHDDELPTLETADLEAVTGGAAASDGMSMMLPMMMMMRKRSAAAPVAAPAPAAPAVPKIMLNGVEQPATAGPNGALSFNANV
jgi:hypothetical protein